MSTMLIKLVTTFINLSKSVFVSVVLTVVTTFYTGQTQKSTEDAGHRQDSGGFPTPHNQPHNWDSHI